MPISAKTDLRSELRRQRKSLTPAVAAHHANQAAAQAWKLPELRRARRVALYLPAGSELSTLPLIQQLWQTGIQIFVPCIHHSNLCWLRLEPATRLRKKQYGILVPTQGPRLRLNQMDVLFLPLVGLDASGTRLGAGGGYYDRALARFRNRRRPLRVGYAYSIQQIPYLPRDAWDIPLHAAVTELGVQRWPIG